MTERNRFDWHTLGAADYSQACALVASLPEGIRGKLRNGEREILSRIVFLCWRYATKSGRGTAYCIPSESYLAACIRRSVRTVQRCLTILREAKLIEWKRRGKGTTSWLTNLYTLGHSFLATLYARQGKKTQLIHHTTKMAHNDLKREYKEGESDEAQSRLEALRQKARLKRSIWPMGPDSSEASGEWEQDIDYTERKKALRKQAAMLIRRGM